MTQPVITLYQPWATWVVKGWKTIETRTHKRFASLVGKEVLIHAGKTVDTSFYATNNPYLSKERMQQSGNYVTGCIVGSVRVLDFKQLDATHSAAAMIDCGSTLRYGLLLGEAKMFADPIPELGEIGIWYYDLEKRRKVPNPERMKEEGPEWLQSVKWPIWPKANVVVDKNAAGVEVVDWFSFVKAEREGIIYLVPVRGSFENCADMGRSVMEKLAKETSRNHPINQLSVSMGGVIEYKPDIHK